MTEPVHRFLHGRGDKLAGHGSARLRPGNQAGLGQDIKVLHDRRQRHVERLREFADRCAVMIAQTRQKRAAGRVGQRAEGSVEGGIHILNHMVKYME